MSRDSLLSDDWPMEWLPFSVEVRPNGQVVELIADGHLDSWTVGTLLRTLAAVYEPSFHEVHLDLRRVTGLDAGTNQLSHGARSSRQARAPGFECPLPSCPQIATRPCRRAHDRPVADGTSISSDQASPSGCLCRVAR